MLHSDHVPCSDLGRLLVVDDDQQMHELLQAGFAGSRFDVVGVASGREALQALAHGDVDLMIPPGT